MIQLTVYGSACLQAGIRAGLSLLGCQQGRRQKGREDFPSLPCCIAAQRRSEPVLSEVEGLLSVALSFVERLDFIIQFLLEKVGSLSLLKWAHFQN